MPEIIMRILMTIHITAGVIALCTFWIPLITAKGGRTHRRAGWCFAVGIAVVCWTTWGICALRLADETRKPTTAIFLSYVGLLAANSCWVGLRVLRFKQRKERHRHPVDLGLPVLLIIASVAIAFYGIKLGTMLFPAFSLIGLATGFGDLRYWLTIPTDRMHWWYHHMIGMFGASIAAVTAFAVVNGSYMRLGQQMMYLVWLGPTIIGVPLLLTWMRIYRARFRAKWPASSNNDVPSKDANS